MKDQSSEDRLITTDNIFGINRLGITDRTSLVNHLHLVLITEKKIK